MIKGGCFRAARSGEGSDSVGGDGEIVRWE